LAVAQTKKEADPRKCNIKSSVAKLFIGLSTMIRSFITAFTKFTVGLVILTKIFAF
jgi:hypothetical protein